MTSPSELRALQPCPNPFCEAADRDGDFSPVVRLHHHGTYRVVCTSCILEGPLRSTKDKAIDAWNQRNNASALLDEIAVLRRAVVAGRPFMRHNGLCGIVGGYGYCTCGLDQALSQSPSQGDAS